MPDLEEGFDDVHFEWTKGGKAAEVLQKWIMAAQRKEGGREGCAGRVVVWARFGGSFGFGRFVLLRGPVVRVRVRLSISATHGRFGSGGGAGAGCKEKWIGEWLVGRKESWLVHCLFKPIVVVISYISWGFGHKNSFIWVVKP